MDKIVEQVIRDYVEKTKLNEYKNSTEDIETIRNCRKMLSDVYDRNVRRTSPHEICLVKLKGLIKEIEKLEHMMRI